jgi:hypothetical protein
VSDVIPTFRRCEKCQRRRDERGDVIEREGPGRAKERFQFRECEFDGVEIRTLRRREAELRTRTFDGGPDFGLSMHGQVVEDHHVAGPQRRHQTLVRHKRES